MRRAKMRFVLVVMVVCILTPISQMSEASPARQTGAPTLVLAHDQYITEAAWSPDGRWILSETSYNTVHIWDTQTGLMVTSLPHVSIWTLPSWSPDSSRLVTWVDQNVWVWETGTWGVLFELQHPRPVVTVDWRPDGQQLAVLTPLPEPESSGQYFFWDATTGTQQMVVNTLHRARSNRGAYWSPDSRYFVSVASDETAVLQMWDSNGQEIESMRQLSSSYALWVLSDVTWSIDGTHLLIDDIKGGAVMFETDTWVPLYVFEDDMYLTRVEWSPNQQWLVGMAAGSRRLPLWNGQTGEFVDFLTDEWFFGDAQWGQNPHHLLTYTSDAGGHGRAEIWDIETRSVLQSVEFNTTSYGIEWSADETLFAVSGDGEDIFRSLIGFFGLRMQV